MPNARNRSRDAWGAAIFAAATLGLLHLVAWASALDAARVAPAAAGLILGALAADFVTGCVHWACDTWGNERTRFFGDGLIRSFREHHDAPSAMLAHHWIDVNGQPAAAAAAAFAVLALPPVREAIGDRAFASAFLWSLVTVAALANQLHQWAHSPAPPRAVRGLQRSGWILSPVRHARHHQPPHTSDYCVANGWLNPALDACGFWRALERAVARSTGAVPRRGARLRGGSCDARAAIVLDSPPRAERTKLESR